MGWRQLPCVGTLYWLKTIINIYLLFFYVFEMWKVEIDICLFDSNLVLTHSTKLLTNHLLQKIIKGNLSFYSGNLTFQLALLFLFYSTVVYFNKISQCLRIEVKCSLYTTLVLFNSPVYFIKDKIVRVRTTSNAD
jgi:hypothetical protein